MKLPVSLFPLLIALAGNASAADQRQAVQDIILDDHTVYSIPVSGLRVTTVSFPGPIAAIDAALVTTDGKSSGLFQLAHTKGTSYFSTRALAKGAATNLNVRWNSKTYVFELKESSEPWYSVILTARDSGRTASLRPLTPGRILGLLDKAKAFPLLRQYHPDAVEGTDYRDFTAQPCVTNCNEYEVSLTEAFRFDADDALVFRLTLRNKTAAPIEFVPERTQIRVGRRVFFPSLTDLNGRIPANGSVSGYVAFVGSPDGGRNDISLKN